MIGVALIVRWLGEVLAGFLFFEVFLLLARVFLPFFHGPGSPALYSLRAMTEWLVRPFRRLTAPLGLRFDLAPILVAVLLYTAQTLVFWSSQWLAFRIDPRAVYPHEWSAIDLVRWPLWAYLFVVLLRVSVSWFGSPEYHPFVRFLARLVDPVLGRIRHTLHPAVGGVDLAPLLLVAGLWFLDRVVLEAIAITLLSKGAVG
jgi:YggT family protein